MKGEQKANATPATSQSERIHQIPLNLIDVGNQLVREDPNDDSIIELAADIQHRGLLQPVGVAPRDAGRYELIFGLRRLLAHRRLQAPSIIARVLDVAPEAIKATALIENIQRQQMTLKEECDAVAHLHLETKLSPDQIAALLSKGRNWVLTRLAVPGLPDDLRTPLLEGRLSQGSAAALALLDDPSARAFILQQVATSSLSVSQVRSLVEAYQATPEIQDAVAAGIAARDNPQPIQAVLMQCAACGIARKLDDLILIRVCRDNCPAGAADHTRTDNAH